MILVTSTARILKSVSYSSVSQSSIVVKKQKHFLLGFFITMNTIIVFYFQFFVHHPAAINTQTQKVYTPG